MYIVPHCHIVCPRLLQLMRTLFCSTMILIVALFRSGRRITLLFRQALSTPGPRSSYLYEGKGWMLIVEAKYNNELQEEKAVVFELLPDASVPGSIGKSVLKF